MRQTITSQQLDSSMPTQHLRRCLHNSGLLSVRAWFYVCLSLLALVATASHAQALNNGANTTAANSAAAGADTDAAARPTASAARGIGRLVISSGATTADNAAGVTRVLKQGDQVYEGDALQTDAAARMQVTFNDGGRLALRPATKLYIEAYHRGDSSRSEQIAFRLERGGFRTATGRIGRSNRTAYRFSTPQAVIGIRGTDWGAVLFDGEDEDEGEQQLNIGVITGGITVSNAGGSVDLGDDAEFSFAVVDSFSSPPAAQSEPPASLGAALETPLLESTGADENAESSDGSDAASQPAADEAANESADAQAGADAKTTEDAEADSAASSSTGSNVATNAGSDVQDDALPLFEVGATDVGEADVVFEYSNRCF